MTDRMLFDCYRAAAIIRANEEQHTKMMRAIEKREDRERLRRAKVLLETTKHITRMKRQLATGDWRAP